MYQVRLLERRTRTSVWYVPQQKGLLFWWSFKDENGWPIVFSHKDNAVIFLTPFKNKTDSKVTTTILPPLGE